MGAHWVITSSSIVPHAPGCLTHQAGQREGEVASKLEETMWLWREKNNSGT